jgi:hypothetical protein
MVSRPDRRGGWAMTSKEVEIAFRVKSEQAAALLEFLS